ncbi:hypothetical protein [Providencia sneebia]
MNRIAGLPLQITTVHGLSCNFIFDELFYEGDADIDCETTAVS